MPIALITGANRGIGLEFVRQYADDGWRVQLFTDAATLSARRGAWVTLTDLAAASS